MRGQLLRPSAADLDDLLLTEVVRFLMHSIVQYGSHVLVRPVRHNSVRNAPEPFTIRKSSNIHLICGKVAAKVSISLDKLPDVLDSELLIVLHELPILHLISLKSVLVLT